MTASTADDVEVLDRRRLREADRTLCGPFAVRLASGGRLTVTRVLRHLPGKRIAADAQLDGQRVLVKLFFGVHDTRHWRREQEGIQALHEAGVPSPALIDSGQLEDGGHFIATTFLARAASVAAAWQPLAERPAGTPEAIAVIAPVFHMLGRLHRAGVTHEDLHLGNFLASDGGLFVIDGDAVRKHSQAPLPTAEATRNLGMLVAQFPLDWEGTLDTLLAAYREGNPSATLVRAELDGKIARARRDRLDDYLSKVRRNCTLFKVERSATRLSVVMREYAEALAPLIADPDRWIAAGALLKDGRSATVARVAVGERTLILKRYNLKGRLHGLTRALRPSRAWHAWVEGHRMRLLGIATPTPLAVIERRVGPFRREAWLITEVCEGTAARWHFPQDGDRVPHDDEARAWRALFATLRRARISHGDLKSHNIFWHAGRLFLIDLDAAQQHDSEAAFERAWRKDCARLLRNWPEGSALHAWLEENLLSPQ